MDWTLNQLYPAGDKYQIRTLDFTNFQAVPPFSTRKHFLRIPGFKYNIRALRLF